MDQPSSRARTWAIVSVAGSALATIGFCVPWFVATGVPRGEFGFSGVQLIQAVLLAPFQPSFLFTSFYLLLAFVVVLLVVLLLITFLASLFDLLERPIAWMARARVGMAWTALLALLVGVGLNELFLQMMAGFDITHSTAILIPGVGIWLMFLGFVATLVSSRARTMPPTAA
jgi:hypothetical protein